MSGEVTRVVFRVWNSDGAVIALFPDLKEWNGDVATYEHIGQHSSAWYPGVVAMSRPAKPEEFEPLRRELAGAPFNYNLRVIAHR
jgi:hypothetical protein